MSKGNLILLIVIAVLLFVVAFGIGWIVFTGNQSANSSEDEITPKYKLAESILHPIAGDAIIANLNTGSLKDKKIIRVKVQLRVADDEIATELKDANAVLVDEIISILRMKTPDEVVQPDAQEVVKQEIIKAVNTSFDTDKILDLYFEEFIVQ